MSNDPQHKRRAEEIAALNDADRPLGWRIDENAPDILVVLLDDGRKVRAPIRQRDAQPAPNKSKSKSKEATAATPAE